MNPSLESGPVPPTSGEPRPEEPSSASLLTSLFRLFDSRLALIQLESADAGQRLLRKAACLVGACFCLLSAWILLIAAAIKFIADGTGWAWSWVAVGLALLHLLLGIILSRCNKSGNPAAYPATRAEFKKDREWIENFTSRKSNG